MRAAPGSGKTSILLYQTSKGNREAEETQKENYNFNLSGEKK